MKKAVLSLSGGMDSATVLAWLIAQGYAVTAYFFFYGSKHNAHERLCARQLSAHYGVELVEVDLSPIMAGLKSNLLQGQGEIPEGHYNDASMSQTVVPGRNIIFLSLLAGYAWSAGAEVIGIGIHQGDHAIYPDCRESFFAAMSSAIEEGTDGQVTIVAPFLSTDKAGILRAGDLYGVPYHLTRTCYKDQSLSCGRCGSCVERLEAFAAIGKTDPVEYAAE